MYRRPKFLEVLLEIRQEMAREADYDVDLFAEMLRAGKFSKTPIGGALTVDDAKKQAGKQPRKSNGEVKSQRNR